MEIPACELFNKLLVLVADGLSTRPTSRACTGTCPTPPDDIERHRMISGGRDLVAPMRSMAGSYRHPPRGIVGGHLSTFAAAACSRPQDCRSAWRAEQGHQLSRHARWLHENAAELSDW